jgi:chemotaxis signal transduction protein
MNDEKDLRAQAQVLRLAFDRSFAEPRTAPIEDVEHIIVVRLAGDAYAIRLREISGLVAKPFIVSVPSRTHGLIGLVGLRGEIVPIFDLASRLGQNEESRTPSWMAVCDGNDTTGRVGLGFSTLEGYCAASKARFRADRSGDAPHPNADEWLSTAHGPYPVIGIRRIVSDINHLAEAQKD